MEVYTEVSGLEFVKRYVLSQKEVDFLCRFDEYVEIEVSVETVGEYWDLFHHGFIRHNVSDVTATLTNSGYTMLTLYMQNN